MFGVPGNLPPGREVNNLVVGVPRAARATGRTSRREPVSSRPPPPLGEGRAVRLTYVPLLGQQRELYRRPRDLKRFRAYLHMTLDCRAKRVRLPTLGMNPMAKGHVADFLDALLALGADAVGEAAVREAG